MTDGGSSDPNLTFSIRSRRAPVDAADALRRALVAHESIEVHPEEFRDRIGPPYERVVAGRLDGEHVRLRIIGTSAGYRRGFTWGVEFRGAFEPASDGSLLRGEVVLRGRWPLVWFLRLFRAVMGLFFLVALGAVVPRPATLGPNSQSCSSRLRSCSEPPRSWSRSATGGLPRTSTCCASSCAARSSHNADPPEGPVNWQRMSVVVEEDCWALIYFEGRADPGFGALVGFTSRLAVPESGAPFPVKAAMGGPTAPTRCRGSCSGVRPPALRRPRSRRWPGRRGRGRPVTTTRCGRVPGRIRPPRRSCR
jgi:hypothetical protein